MRKAPWIHGITPFFLATLLAHAALAETHYDDTPNYGPEAEDFEFTLAGSGSNEEEFDAGAFSFAGSLGYFFNEHFEIGLRHSMTFFDSDETDATLAATTRVFSDFHFDLGRFQPFIGANIGGRYGDSVKETGTVAPEAGLKLFVLEDVFVLGMAEYQFFFEDSDDIDDIADDGQFVYTVGIGFNF